MAPSWDWAAACSLQVLRAKHMQLCSGWWAVPGELPGAPCKYTQLWVNAGHKSRECLQKVSGLTDGVHPKSNLRPTQLVVGTG